MICRTLHPKSAWSCEINMSWDTNQAITSTTPGGEKSRSSCARSEGAPAAHRLRQDRLLRARLTESLPIFRASLRLQPACLSWLSCGDAAPLRRSRTSSAPAASAPARMRGNSPIRQQDQGRRQPRGPAHHRARRPRQIRRRPDARTISASSKTRSSKSSPSSSARIFPSAWDW